MTGRLVALNTVAALFCGIILLPLYWMVVTALRRSEDIVRWPPKLLPNNLTLEHFWALSKTGFPAYVANSLVIAVIVVIFVNVAAIPAGYALSRSQSRLIRFAGVASLLGYMVAPIMLVIPFYVSMRFLGLTNTKWSLVLAHTSFCLPFALWLMKSYFDDLPIELEKAARVDGASRTAVLLLVVVPQVRAGVAAVSIFTFILSWNDYIFARILVADDAAKTIPVGIEDIASATVVDWGLLMASGVTVTVPVLIAFIMVHRTFIRGWGHSGLKG